MKNIKSYFTRSEVILWCISAFLIIFSFALFDRESYLTLTASLIGVTSLILNAKGNPIGQALMMVFSVIYGIISFEIAYYGEMLTYIGMTAPMALLALIAWLRNPYKGKRSEVKVGKVERRDIFIMSALTVIVTVVFYFILEYFGTANMLPSTISITTSFIAVYLTFKRSPYFAIAYASNDIVLIVLWTMASISDLSYISVVICFAMFLLNDIYGFISWKKMEKRQSE